MKRLFGFFGLALLWLLGAFLNIGVAFFVWARIRLKHGPSARMWLASDLEIAAEAKRRGLFKRRKKKRSSNVLPMPTVYAPEVFEFNANGELAVKTVMQLQQVPKDRAAEAVRKALEKLPRNAKVDEIVVAAIKFAA